MKKGLIFKKLLAIILSIVAIRYISCERTKPPEPDYREKWVGEYECEAVDGSNVYQTLVSITAESDSMLKIFDKYNAKINIDGEFRFDFPYAPDGGGSGYFIDDSLNMSVYHRQGQGGPSWSTHYKGKKLKNK